jgi:hypothetical protein
LPKPPPRFHQRRRKKFQHLKRPITELCWTTNEESEKGKVKFAYFITRTTKSLPKKKDEFKPLNTTQKEPQRETITNGPAKEKKNAQG